MSADNSFQWSEIERRLVDGILDQIIPKSTDGRVPAAGALGVAEFIFAKAADDENLLSLLQHGVAHALALVQATGRAFSDLDNDQQHVLVKQLEEFESEFFAVLIRDTYMGYYSRADIRPLFGLSEKPTQPDGYDVPIEDSEDLAALVEPVKSRGGCFRVC